jgi:hypothetical protein
VWELLFAAFAALCSGLRSRRDLVFENFALRQQLAAYHHTRPRPTLRPLDRAFWIALRAVWARWSSVLVIVKPATVIAWHRAGFRIFWKVRSRFGRPPIPRPHVDLIRRINRENPTWGEDRIAAELRLKLGVLHSESTVRRYMFARKPRSTRPIRGGQTWKTFLRNHAKEIYACDFLVQPTALFSSVYVFVVIHLDTRKVVHVNATSSPTLAWVRQQVREACPFDAKPRFLIHDNDGIFGQLRRAGMSVGIGSRARSVKTASA